MSEGLSQDDFRRLMATPRRPAEGDSAAPQPNKFKMPAPRAPRNAGNAIFAQPRSMRKNNFKKKKAEGEEDEEEETEKVNYRDRAAERRQLGDEDDTQITTEELLKRTQAEVGDELDAKQLYDQSKFLGGDVDHTHLVKGLDFALLKKIRSDLSKKHQTEEEEEEDDQALDDVLEKFERGEKVQDERPAVEVQKFHSVMAKNIAEIVQQQHNPELQPKIELFETGRMAYVFELADEVGHYSDAFAIPTAMIRSKADVDAKLAKSGWSEDIQAETKLVIERISRVMASVRRGERGKQPTEEKKKTGRMTSEPVAIVEDGFMGDIFADVGRDYELDESKKSSQEESTEQKGSYFAGLIDENEDIDMEEATSNDAVNALLSKATGKETIGNNKEDKEEEREEDTNKKRKYNTMIDVDADAADIDMFGLSSSALPTSFKDHQTTAYQSDDDENMNEEDTSTTQMMDQGTNRNKKAQLTRWDFETEEEWQNYKDKIEILPKSAFQFGIKLGDGRKRNRDRKGMSEKQKFDRDYQQVKNIMTKKYGQSLDQ